MEKPDMWFELERLKERWKTWMLGFILIIGFGLMAWKTHKTSRIKEQD